VQLQEQRSSVDGANIALVWLVWLLPGMATALLVVYLLNATFGLDLGATAWLIATGRGGEILAYLMRLSLWGFGQTAQVISANGPLVLIGATVAALVWLVRQL
jgi:hypothetical protein